MRTLPDHYFYGYETIASDTLTFSFSADEARHATRALRLRVGDELQWTDGRGSFYRGALTEVDRRGMSARVLARQPARAPFPVELGVGVLHDAGRMEWLVEKATELGATRITLLTTSRTERASYKLTRLHGKIIAALKQSGRAFLPELRELPYADILAEGLGGHEVGYVAHCRDELTREPLFERVSASRGSASGCRLLLGPEGDFTETEIVAATDRGYVGVSLGTARLRSETAAIYALSLAGSYGPEAP